MLFERISAAVFAVRPEADCPERLAIWKVATVLPLLGTGVR